MQMINQKVERALNAQMNKEFYSSYLYLSMAAHFESLNLKGLGHWMRIQSQEEYGHAMKFFGHLIEREGKVTLPNIDSPPFKWESPERVFRDAYEHEKKVTKSIHDLLELAKAEKDHAAELFLQWFVKEQVEEEASANEITQKLHMIGGNGAALLMLDSELGKRSPSKE
jgi:ferritin